MKHEARALLERIRIIEFMALELNLYLDTHPDDKRAISEYNCYVKQLMDMKREFEMIHGPLINFGFSYSQYPWRWINDPWPWEEAYWMEEC